MVRNKNSNKKIHQRIHPSTILIKKICDICGDDENIVSLENDHRNICLECINIQNNMYGTQFSEVRNVNGILVSSLIEDDTSEQNEQILLNYINKLNGRPKCNICCPHEFKNPKNKNYRCVKCFVVMHGLQDHEMWGQMLKQDNENRSGFKN